MCEGFYTYVYFDPRTETPFFVGKGRKHRAYAKNGRNKEVMARIAQIESDGLSPSVEIAVVPTEQDALWFEKDLISSLGRIDIGTGPLLNRTVGGDGCSFGAHSDGARKSISSAMTGNARRSGKKFTEAQLERISLGVRKSMTPERLEQLRAAGLKGSKRSAELGLNNLWGSNLKKGRRAGGYSNI